MIKKVPLITTLIIILLIVYSPFLCFSAYDIEIINAPDYVPRNASLMYAYSPGLEIKYSGLTEKRVYTLKLWLLERGGWYCGSTQYCEHNIDIDNTSGNNTEGIVYLNDTIDVFDYPTFDWLVRLYAGSTHLCKAEKYATGTKNRPPKLDSIGGKTINLGETIEFTLAASDLDYDNLSFSAANLPEGAGFNPSTVRFIWTPLSGGIYKNIRFQVTDDGEGHLYDTELINIEVNTCPSIHPVNNKEALIGYPLEFNIEADDPDGERLTYNVNKLLQGASFDTTTGNFYWKIPDDISLIGTHELRFSVTDGKCEDAETININIMSCPVFEPVPDKNVKIGNALEFTLSAYDPDGDTNLTYGIIDPPPGSDFNSVTGHFYWLPNQQELIGIYNVSFSVSDGQCERKEYIDIKVTANNCPVLNPIKNKKVTVGNALEFSLEAHDLDGDTLVYSAQNIPPGASFNETTGNFYWRPEHLDLIGEYNTSFIISDGECEKTESISIEVTPFCYTTTNTSMFLWGEGFIDDLPVEPGDWIGVYSPDITTCEGCIGAFKITHSGEYGTLPLYGDDINTTYIKEGAAIGDMLRFKAWDASERKIIDLYPLGPDAPVWKADKELIQVNLVNKTPQFCFNLTNTSMFIWGEAFIDDLPVEPGDWIGVYAPGLTECDGCIGTFMITNKGSYGVLTAYGDDPGTLEVKEGAAIGDILRFKAWDASEGKIIDLYPQGPDAPVWKADKELIQINLTSRLQQQAIYLPAGWSLISFQVAKCYYQKEQPNLYMIEQIIDQNMADFEKKESMMHWLNDNENSPIRDSEDPNIAGDWQRVVSFDEQGAHLLDRNLPDYINNLHYITFGYGYWVKMNSPGELIINGKFPPSDTGLKLRTGWSLMGYIPGDVCYTEIGTPKEDICPYKNGIYPDDENIRLCRVDPLINTVFESIYGKFRRIISFDECKGAMLYDTELPDFANTLYYLGPKYGYWIKMLEDAELVFPGKGVCLDSL